MKSMLPLAVTTLLSLALPFLVFAKGDTIRIVIGGVTLWAAIDISDPGITRRFNVWSQPGDSEGVYVDWSRGTANPRDGLPSYIRFLRDCTFKPEHIRSALRD